jgi:hypothetical protein
MDVGFYKIWLNSEAVFTPCAITIVRLELEVVTMRIMTVNPENINDSSFLTAKISHFFYPCKRAFHVRGIENPDGISNLILGSRFSFHFVIPPLRAQGFLQSFFSEN